jgi:hypothetical protein
MKKLTFFISILTLLVSCNTGNSNSSDSSERDESTAWKIERAQPTGVLTAGEICMSGVDGDSINIHGVIKNASPSYSYKDVVVKITYYSDAKKKLGDKEYTIDKVFPPHSDVRVELKVENCKDLNTIDWQVLYGRVEKQIK